MIQPGTFDGGSGSLLVIQGGSDDRKSVGLLFAGNATGNPLVPHLGRPRRLRPFLLHALPGGSGGHLPATLPPMRVGSPPRVTSIDRSRIFLRRVLRFSPSTWAALI